MRVGLGRGGGMGGGGGERKVCLWGWELYQTLSERQKS